MEPLGPGGCSGCLVNSVQLPWREVKASHLGGGDSGAVGEDALGGGVLWVLTAYPQNPRTSATSSLRNLACERGLSNPGVGHERRSDTTPNAAVDIVKLTETGRDVGE